MPAERSSEEDRSGEEQSYAVRSSHHGSVAVLSRYRIRKRLPAGLTSSRETALENGETDWGDCSAVDKARSALSRFSGPRNIQAAYRPYFIYGGKTALLHVVTSCSNGFSAYSQRVPLDGADRPVKTVEEVDRAA